MPIKKWHRKVFLLLYFFADLNTFCVIKMIVPKNGLFKINKSEIK